MGGPRDHDDDGDMAALACTLAGARLEDQVGRPRGGALSGSPLPGHVRAFPAAGCTPDADEMASPEDESPKALLEWWRSVCAEDAADVDDEGSADHVASAWATGWPSPQPREGGKGGPGGGSPPAVPAFSWEMWVNDWLEGDGGADGGWELDGDVHWIPYEHPGSVRPGTSTSVHEASEPGPAERRSAAELDGWPAVEGHQRRNAGWALRHGGNARMGAGLEVSAATADERRLGHRIRHCGERLVFRAPDCECDPHARPSLVGANLCTHRMCHHCARLRSRKLAGRVRDRRLWEPVLGSVATIEIKRGERSGLWHPHLHVLVARPSCGCLRGRHSNDDGPLCIHGRICCPHALNQRRRVPGGEGEQRVARDAAVAQLAVRSLRKSLQQRWMQPSPATGARRCCRRRARTSPSSATSSATPRSR
jgi:hypothetical protein